jgi:hypothetical protein
LGGQDYNRVLSTLTFEEEKRSNRVISYGPLVLRNIGWECSLVISIS